MDIFKKIEKNGIIPIKEIEIFKKNNIAKQITEKICDNNLSLTEMYNEIYMKLFNCRMYYANVDDKFNGVFYYYKNNAIYIDVRRNIEQIDEYLLHEAIHYLQNLKNTDKEIERIGLCKFEDFKVFGLGLNEAVIQYIAAKSLGMEEHRINNETISIYTNSEKYYKYMTSLIAQLFTVIDSNQIIESCINSNDKYENILYNTFEENTDKIIKNLDTMLDENDKDGCDEEKLQKIYMQTQELIYKTYFTKALKNVTNTFEVDEIVNKMQDYELKIGKLFNNQENDKFAEFKQEMDNKFLSKYVEITRKQSKNSLIIFNKNKLNELFKRIVDFIKNKAISVKNK